MTINHSTLVFIFGILGNIISCMVTLSPLTTFYEIYKRKTAQGFQSIPYVVALFSAMLWIYYALLQENTTLLITINVFCCVVQTLYISAYLYYAPKKDKILSVKFLLLFNVFGFGTIYILTTYLVKDATRRVHILGYICMGLSIAVFVAPLCILRKVVKTKSVEYMPFFLSLFLTLGAVMWFFYGLLVKDINISLPNVLGFLFGITQMVLYMIYRKSKKSIIEIIELEHVGVDIAKLSSMCVVPQLSSDSIEEAILIQQDENHMMEEVKKAKQNKDMITIDI